MVNPLYMFILFLTAGFLFAIIDKMGRKFSLGIFYGVLAINSFIPIQWFIGILSGSTVGTEISTAGFLAPLSINLRFGFEEIIIILLTNILAFLTAIYLADKFTKCSINGLILFVIMIMGINGLVMTRDIFNIFVFLEILSISTFSFIAIDKNRASLSAGFKYMLAGGIASAFILIGIIFLYKFTGTLNLDDMISKSTLIVGKSGFLAVFIFLFAILLELKPFPANGWALDVYQAVNEGLVSIIAVASSGAIFFVLYKFLPLLPKEYYGYVGGIGLVTFFFSNLIGMKQDNPNRLLGYSSIGQIGLLIAALGFLKSYDIKNLNMLQVVGGLFINHFFAKAGLFWIVGIVKKKSIKEWVNLKSNPSLMIFFGVFILALSGLPPFPGFWAKWDFIKILALHKNYLVIISILLASLFEIVYLFRWFGYSLIKIENGEKINSKFHKELPVAILSIFLFVSGYIITHVFKSFGYLQMLPIIGLIIMYIIDYLPTKIKGFVAIAFTSYYAFLLYGMVSGIGFVFAAILVGGSIIQIVATMYKDGKREGFYPFLVMMIIAMGNLTIAESYLAFFFQWELMTIASYFLIIRGRKAQSAALTYIVFSMGAAYFILAGFAFAPSLVPNKISLIQQIGYSGFSLISIILLSVGFLIKIGSLGFHVWVPNAYAKAEDDTTSFLSSILSKAGIFGFMIIVVAIVKNNIQNIDYYLTAISWIGVITAFAGALMAAFQEDIKKIVAYSSLSQLGYIILTMAAMNHVGWLSALHLSVNHMLFKMMIFLAFAGVILRTKTTNMYEMGGLIKKMPWSYISVLVAIIGLSGVPPLSGFGIKWMIYNSLVERGWYLQAGLALFASGVAFLYLFRLIYTVFLGQAKPQHKDVKAAPLWLLIPQYIGIAVVMLISMKPILILQPLSNIIAPYIPSNLEWVGNTLITQNGYWNGFLIMNVTMVIFGVPFLWILMITRKVQKVKQFNIVFAAERPDKPETTHFAHNMYAHYNKALGFLVTPKLALRFWNMISEWVSTSGTVLRNFYSGNGQTYILQIILYFLVIYSIMGGK